MPMLESIALGAVAGSFTFIGSSHLRREWTESHQKVIEGPVEQHGMAGTTSLQNVLTGPPAEKTYAVYNGEVLLVGAETGELEAAVALGGARVTTDGKMVSIAAWETPRVELEFASEDEAERWAAELRKAAHLHAPPDCADEYIQNATIAKNHDSGFHNLTGRTTQAQMQCGETQKTTMESSEHVPHVDHVDLAEKLHAIVTTVKEAASRKAHVSQTALNEQENLRTQLDDAKSHSQRLFQECEELRVNTRSLQAECEKHQKAALSMEKQMNSRSQDGGSPTHVSHDAGSSPHVLRAKLQAAELRRQEVELLARTLEQRIEEFQQSNQVSGITTSPELNSPSSSSSKAIMLADAVDRVSNVEKERDDARAKVSALEDELHSLKQSFNDQENIANTKELTFTQQLEMESARVAEKNEIILQLKEELESWRIQVSSAGDKQEALLLRAARAEGKADALEKKIEELAAQGRGREQQILELNTAVPKLQANADRAVELETLCYERNQQIAQLASAAARSDHKIVQLEEALARKDALKTDNEALLQRVAEIEANAAQSTKAFEHEKAQLFNQFEKEKETLQARFNQQSAAQSTKAFEHEKIQLFNQFEKEKEALQARLTQDFEARYSIIQQRLAQTESEIHSPPSKSSIHSQDVELVKKMEEVEAGHKFRFPDAQSPPRDKKLSHGELKALQQRIVASETRAGTAELKQRELEQELVFGSSNTEKLMHENANLRNQLGETWNQIHKQTEKIEAERSVFLEELDRVRQSVNFANSTGRNTPQVPLDHIVEPIQRTISPLRGSTDAPFGGQVQAMRANVIPGTMVPDVSLSKTRISTTTAGKSPTAPSRRGAYVSSASSSAPSMQNNRLRRSSAPKAVVSGSGSAPVASSIPQQSPIPTSMPPQSMRPLHVGRVSTQSPSDMQPTTLQQVTRPKRLSPAPSAKIPSPTKKSFG